jgi:hypothetical protein
MDRTYPLFLNDAQKDNQVIVHGYLFCKFWRMNENTGLHGFLLIESIDKAPKEKKKSSGIPGCTVQKQPEFDSNFADQENLVKGLQESLNAKRLLHNLGSKASTKDLLSVLGGGSETSSIGDRKRAAEEELSPPDGDAGEGPSGSRKSSKKKDKKSKKKSDRDEKSERGEETDKVDSDDNDNEGDDTGLDMDI